MDSSAMLLPQELVSAPAPAAPHLTRPSTMSLCLQTPVPKLIATLKAD